MSSQHDDRQERMQALRLLKSKLRAGKGQQKTNQHVVSFNGPKTNHHKESSEQLMPSVTESDATKSEQHTAAQDSTTRKLPAAAPSTIEVDCHQRGNQDEVSVAGLRRELAELKSTSSCGDPPFFPIKMKSYTKTMIQWICDACERECIPVREESRCLCGHRYKNHPSSVEDPRVKKTANSRAFACTWANCSCKEFFYVVAEGAWILRCRCKHKHIDHDSGKKPFVCRKLKCGCAGFDSPWVCNCDHPWAAHKQHRVTKKFNPLQLLQGQCELEELNTVHRTNLLASPLAPRR